jgi:hypothetical protein
MAKTAKTERSIVKTAKTGAFVDQPRDSKPVRGKRVQSVDAQREAARAFERIAKGRDVIFSGAWKPGRVLSSKS